MLDCAPNFRDVGGARTEGGRTVRSGAIYRSEALMTPGPDDLERLAQLGIRSVLDIRSERERSRYPGHWSGQPVALHAIEVTADPRAPTTSLEILIDDPTARGARAFMVDVNARMPGIAMPAVLTLFKTVAAGDVPLLVHCTAGKDRTGFLIAVLLLALGVPMAAVMADYLASADRLSADTLAGTRHAIDGRLEAPLADDAFAEILGVRPEYLSAAVDSAVAAHGSIEAYLRAAGVTPALLNSVRARLLD